MLICVTDCPYDLLIVTANADFTGNWQHLKTNGNFAEEGVSEMHGMKTSCLAWRPANNCALMIRCVTMSQSFLIHCKDPV
jgi:hypothetical protein